MDPEVLKGQEDLRDREELMILDIQEDLKVLMILKI